MKYVCARVSADDRSPALQARRFEASRTRDHFRGRRVPYPLMEPRNSRWISMFAAAGVDQGRRYYAQRAALLDVARGAEESLGALQGVRIHAARERLAGGRNDGVVSARQTGDGIQQDDHVALVLGQPQYQEVLRAVNEMGRLLQQEGPAARLQLV